MSLMVPHKKHKRTPKACDYCRGKKIKCDGASPCTKCEKLHLVCTYNYVPKRRTLTKRSGAKRQRTGSRSQDNTSLVPTPPMDEDNNPTEGASFPFPNASSLSDPRNYTSGMNNKQGVISLRQRLDNLERMMGILVSKVAPEAVSALYTTGTSSASSLEPLSPNGDCCTSPSASNKIDVDSRESAEPVAVVSSSNEPTRGSLPDNLVEHCVAAHAPFSVFSARGLKWMDHKVNDPQVTLPLRRFLSGVVHVEHRPLSVWVDPIEKSQVAALPSRETIEMLMAQMRPLSVMMRFVDGDYVLRLLKLYCDSRDKLIPEPHFTYSELLLMNGSLLLACSVYVEKQMLYKNPDGPLKPAEVTQLRELLLKNALFYYHRVSVVFDGLTGIRGILLLAIYADIVSLSQSAYLISSVAIRQAQDMGLHLASTYRSLGESERNRRLTIWWTCYYFDRDFAIRSGKPPILDDADISAPQMPGFEKYWNPTMQKEAVSKEMCKELQAKQATCPEPTEDVNHVLYVKSRLARIMSFCYRELFCANAQLKTPWELYKSAQQALDELERWRMDIPQAIRPASNFDPTFVHKLATLKEQQTTASMHQMYMLLSMYLRYHHMRLIINKEIAKLKYTYRFPSETGDLFRRVNNALHDCISSSLVIMRFSTSVAFAEGNNFLMFYPFSACITVCLRCIQKPSSPQISNYINTLIDCIRNCFSHTNTGIAREKWWITDQIVRCMFYIAVTVARQHNPTLQFDCDDLLESIFTVDSSNAVNPLSDGKPAPKRRNTKRAIYNVPVASLLVPPDLRFGKNDGAESSEPRSEQNWPSNGSVDVLPPVIGSGSPSDLSQMEVPAPLMFDETADNRSLNTLLELFSRNEASTKDSEASSTDMAMDGEALFQNMFNIPVMMVDEGSHLTVNSPQSRSS